MKKKIVFLIIILLIICTFLNFDTILAQTFSNSSAENNFSLGTQGITSLSMFDLENNIVLSPDQEFDKTFYFYNQGSIDSYFRVQVWIPMSDDIKLVSENDESIIDIAEPIPIFSYTIEEVEWSIVEDEGFSGVYTDDDGNTYKIETYKIMENGKEKVFETDEQSDFTVQAKTVNYIDMDKQVDLNIYVQALFIQTSTNKTADEMWDYYKVKNQTEIVGVK